MTPTEPHKEIVGFIADEMSGAGELFVTAAATALRRHLARSILLMSHPSGPVLILWIDEHVSYTVVMTEQAMRAIAENAGQYCDDILGLGNRVRVIVGYELPAA